MSISHALNINVSARKSIKMQAKIPINKFKILFFICILLLLSGIYTYNRHIKYLK